MVWKRSQNIIRSGQGHDLFSPLLFENLDVFVGFPFVWAEEQEISFPRTLGICDSDARCDGGFHDDPPQ
jgi:hypothetical protein